MNGVDAIIYEANSRPTMKVVTESYTGVMMTYFFTLKPGDDVWVMYGGDAQVHIPALCQKSAPGDQTRSPVPSVAVRWCSVQSASNAETIALTSAGF